ncbi:MAG: DUF2125 domain-containing protein [Rhodobacteraceae bacterium]|nr:DUF2125 domain-containing protein [Paracoccaceae bacterium]
MIIRIMIAVTIVASLIWSGYWFYGSSLKRRTIENVIAELNEPGRRVGYSNITLRGFPNRFDLTIQDPFYEDAAIAWSAPFLQVLSLSYQPYRFVFAFPDLQRVEWRGKAVDVTAESMRASLSLHYRERPELGAFIIEAEGIEFSGTSGWRHQFGNSLAAIQQSDGTENSYDLALRTRHHPGEAEPLPGNTTAAILANMTAVELDMDVTFDRAIDAEFCTGPEPLLTDLALTHASLRWPQSGIDLSGEFTNQNGGLTGTLTIDPGQSGFAALLGTLPLGPRLGLMMLMIFEAVEATFGTDGAPVTLDVSRGKLSFGDFEIVALPGIEFC